MVANKPKAENKKFANRILRAVTWWKKLDWIKCYAKGDYTYVQEGMPIWPEYDDTSMSIDLEPEPGIPIQVGLDFGLTPAAVFAQRMPNGRWHVLHELVYV